MGENTAIEWADHTFNPWIGCQRVSAACDHCYAETLMDTRLGAVEWGPGKPRKRTSEANWRQPRKWDRAAAKSGRQARVFCASLADVFDNAVPSEWRTDLWQLIDDTPHLTWMLLTKRPQNIARMMPSDVGDGRVWLGTTAENQEEAERRIPVLIDAPAAVRFVSAEPLLGPIDMREWLESPYLGSTHTDEHGVVRYDIGGYRYDGIGWVIVGGESGPGARPMHPIWVRSILDQCGTAGVPFFLKQWGAWRPVPEVMSRLGSHALFEDGRFVETRTLYDNGRFLGSDDDRFATLNLVGKKRAGRTLDGCTFDGVPA